MILPQSRAPGPDCGLREGAGEIPMKAAKPFARCPEMCAHFHVRGAEGEYGQSKPTVYMQNDYAGRCCVTIYRPVL